MPERLRFFPGQVLTVADFEAEQTYQIKMRRLHNQLLHGSGVVAGLTVSINSNSPDTITVAPGFALDGMGREIVVDTATPLTLQGWAVDTGFVTLSYTETAIDPVPVLDGPSEFSRIKEGFAIALALEDPQQNGKVETSSLAKINRRQGLWHLDNTYKVKRLKANH